MDQAVVDQEPVQAREVGKRKKIRTKRKRETACNELSVWETFTNWISSIAGEQAPLRRINDWFDDNPNNRYLNPEEYQRLRGASTLSSRNARPDWTSIIFRESLSRMTARGFEYSAANSAGAPPVPQSMDGTYARSARVPRSVTGGSAGVGLLSRGSQGQATAATTLSKFAFSYHNFTSGIWGVSDVSGGFPGDYLEEAQAREIMADIYKWYGRDLSPSFYKKGKTGI